MPGLHDAQDLQRSNQAVTGRGIVAKDHVTALFPSEVEAVAQHFINDIPVTYRGAHHAPPRRRNSGVQTGVAHHRADERLLGELLLRQHIKAGDSHEIISVY